MTVHELEARLYGVEFQEWLDLAAATTAEDEARRNKPRPRPRRRRR